MIIGYRDFRLYYSYNSFRLRAYSNAYVWDVGVNQARCSPTPMSARDHLATGSCTCGFYALKDSSRLNKFAPLHGAVLMWGKVVEHEFGYRAEFAQVESLFLPEIANCQKGTHPIDSRDLLVLVDSRPLEPFTACSACRQQLSEHARGYYEPAWQTLTYSEVLSQLAQTYGVPLIKHTKIGVELSC